MKRILMFVVLLISTPNAFGLTVIERTSDGRVVQYKVPDRIYTKKALPRIPRQEVKFANIPRKSSYRQGSGTIGNFVRPVNGYISNPVGLHGKRHNALDFHANVGTPVKSFADGTVVSTVWNPRSGWVLTLSHAGGVKSIYCHLSKFLVKPGQVVRAGQVVAKSGDTGWNCRGAHLHFDIAGMKNPFASDKKGSDYREIGGE